MIGDERLVPPIVHQCSFNSSHSAPESCTAKPVYGSASADTSATARPPEQPTAPQLARSSCQAGAANVTLQPPPPAPLPFHTVSPVQTPLLRLKRVPPTATTSGEEAGNSA